MRAGVRGGSARRRSGAQVQRLLGSVREVVSSSGGSDPHQHLTHSLLKNQLRRRNRRAHRPLKRNPQNQQQEPNRTEPNRTMSRKSALKQNPQQKPSRTEPSRSSLKQNQNPGQRAPRRKQVRFQQSSVKEEQEQQGERSAGSALDLRKRSRALMKANEAEDQEIRRLEKKLGLHRRRNKQNLPLSFINDGLDYVLQVLQPTTDTADHHQEEEEPQTKRSRLQEEDEEESSEEEEKDDEEEDDDDEEEEDDEEEDDEEEEESEPDDDDDGEKDDEEESIKDQQETNEPAADDDDDEEEESQVNQNVPVKAGGKYVPPQLRNQDDTKHKAEIQRLKRNLNGLINRLSEHNMSSICSQVGELYMSCSRRDMNQVLTEVLMAACVTPALMPDRLLMEHMLLVSVLHHTVGLEVGAHFLEEVVCRFDGLQQDDSAEGKQSSNLACMMAHLYNFQVVDSLLMFDLLKKLLLSFKEHDVELILLLLKNVGFSLRRDDPLALKGVISDAQRKASAEGHRYSDQNRVRFMLENMLALKNNDVRKIAGYDPEPVERLKKLQRSLIQNRAGGTDVKLRVSLQNLLEAQQVGRWWIVGSSWSGAPMIGEDRPPEQTPPGEQFSAKVLELARKQRMNTDVRRNIFCIIMTSEDYLHAFHSLLRLGLKGQQERDIVHVLLDCCLQERTFNAFYAVLTETFCSHDRRFQVTLQFSLWDKIKDLATLSRSSFKNLVQMLIHLLQKNALSLSVLKVIEFGELDALKVKFLRQLLSRLLQETQLDDLLQMFNRISGLPKLEMLREGLKLFIRHFLLRTQQLEETLLAQRSEVAIKAMEAQDSKLKL